MQWKVEKRQLHLQLFMQARALSDKNVYHHIQVEAAQEGADRICGISQGGAACHLSAAASEKILQAACLVKVCRLWHSSSPHAEKIQILTLMN